MTDIRHTIVTRLPALPSCNQRLRGVFNRLSCPAIVEMSAYTGFDLIIFDNEHGSADFETTENMLRAARASGILSVRHCFPQDISRMPNMGTGAIKIPMVNSAEEARALVQQVRYPATSRRGGSTFSPRAADHDIFPGADTPRRATRTLPSSQ